MAGKPKFEAPVLKEIGTVRELTLQAKNFGSSDGFTFLGQPIGTSG